MRTRIVLCINLLLFWNLLAPDFVQAKVPALIKSQDIIFIEVCDLLEQKLARDIEILVYDPDIFTASPLTRQDLENDFKQTLSAQNLVRRFTTIPVQKALEKSKSIEIERLDEADHRELIQIAAMLNIEAVLMTSIMVFEKEMRKLWDKKQKKWVKRKAALIQGNIFNSTDGSIIVRFSYYFLLGDD